MRFWRKKSSSINRQEIAEELASIRVRRLSSPGLVSTDFGREVAKRMSELQREIWTELFLMHYSNRQLRGLRDFYRSDVGRSIVETDVRIEAEFQKELRARMERFGREMEGKRR